MVGRKVCLIAAALLTAACDGAVDDDSVPVADVTFHEDVEPILHKHCLGCHSPGGIGPYSFVEYQAARTRAHTIAEMVEARKMPPFPADNTENCEMVRPVKDDLRLTEEEIATFRAWVDQGAEEGDPAAAPPPYVRPEPGLADRDLDVLAATEVTVDGDTDQFICVVFDPELTESKFIDGIYFDADNDIIDHHALIAQVKRDELPVGSEGGSFECFGSLGQMIHAWAPGHLPLELPPTVAIQLEADDVLVVQMHYHPNGEPQSDQSTLQLRFTEETPAYIYTPVLLGNFEDEQEGLLPGPNDNGTTQFLVPANVPDHTEDMEYLVPPDVFIPLKILATATHMHYVGTNMRISVERPFPGVQAPEECLLETPRWSFGWQRFYLYDVPLEQLPTVTNGDTVRFHCEYDNTMENPGVERALEDAGLSVPQDVLLGESTLNEMCIGAFGVLVPYFP